VASLPLENRLLVQEKDFCGVFNGGGRKKKKQKKKICSGEREDLAVAAPIAGEDLGLWGG